MVQTQAQDQKNHHQENASKGHMLKNGLRMREDPTVQAQGFLHQGKEKNGKEDPKLLLLQGKDVMRDGTLKKREEEKNG